MGNSAVVPPSALEPLDCVAHMDGGLAKPADDQELLMAVPLMTDAIDGDEGAVVVFIIFSLTGTYSKSIKMDSGPERRGQLKTQHGSPVLSVHLRNGGV